MNTEDLIYAITGSILLTVALIAVIIWLFKYSKIAKEETETKIKLNKEMTKYFTTLNEEWEHRWEEK